MPGHGSGASIGEITSFPGSRYDNQDNCTLWPLITCAPTMLWERLQGKYGVKWRPRLRESLRGFNGLG